MRWTYLVGAILLFVMFIPTLASLYSEYLWFLQVGYAAVFLKIIKTKLVLGAIGAAFFFVIALINFRKATKSALGDDSKFSGLVPLAALAFAFVMGFISSFGWDIFLRFSSQVPFDVTEPIFNKDIGFYFFSLPFYEYIKNVLLTGFFLMGIVTLGFYMFFGGALVSDEESGTYRFEMPNMNWSYISHLLVIAGIILILFGVGNLLDRYSILYSERGAVYGAGYTDVKVQLPLITTLAVLFFIAAITTFAAAKFYDIKWPIFGIALLMIVSITGNSAAGFIQQYKVTPDEYNMEAPYLSHNILLTRAAYDIDNIKEVEFSANTNLTLADLEKNSETIDNIRLWDWRPLKQTYEQLQLIRTYYDFNDVDIDRYDINGSIKQVMLSAREVNPDLLPEKTWVNEHLVFTHGYGLAMSPVRSVSEEGLPFLFIKNIPPESDFFDITQPEIYYGEITRNYVIVNSKTDEFDYSMGDENIYTTYQGEGGIKLSSVLRRAVMALRYNSLKLFLSDSVTPESKIMIHRNIMDRVNAIAPFLKYDSDPYLVTSGGRMYWMIDGYTVSSRYPYSEPTGNINYIRNPVKIVIDAYNGKTTFYVIGNEPIIDVYRKIFPGLFLPFSEMSEDLMGHIRYPEDLFSVQASKYLVYHMQDTRVFYNKEDQWEVPQEIYEGTRINMEPYYLITKLPGEVREEFLLLLPFTPRSKPNMIAWMAARGDLENYGERIVYVFPKNKLIYGPIQIEARIDQNTDISQDFTLWGQSGSRVIRGNLLVIPIEDSLLYVEPVYLSSDQRDAIPELKRVIVAFGDKLTMQNTLEESLSVVFGSEEIPSVPRPPKEVPSEKEERTEQELISAALEHYKKAEEHLKDGNWSSYGEELRLLESILTELDS